MLDATVETSTTYAVRHAKWEEREEIVDLYIKNLWPIAHFQPDTEEVFKTIYRAIDDNRCLVVERNGDIVGSTSYIVSSYWYSKQPVICDTGFFVLPEQRKSRATAKLLDGLKREAKRHKALLIIGAGTRDRSVAAILAKRYPLINSAFVVTH